MRTVAAFEFAGLLIAAGAAITGCAKNDAATAACSSMTGAESCNGCCTTNGATGYKYMTACTCLGSSGKPAAAAAAPGSTTSFAGTYKSTFGQAVVTQVGNDVSVKYARGNMTCTAAGNALDCSWREGATSGRAKLVKETSGTIRGTWGNGFERHRRGCLGLRAMTLVARASSGLLGSRTPCDARPPSSSCRSSPPAGPPRPSRPSPR